METQQVSGAAFRPFPVNGAQTELLTASQMHELCKDIMQQPDAADRLAKLAAEYTAQVRKSLALAADDDGGVQEKKRATNGALAAGTRRFDEAAKVEGLKSTAKSFAPLKLKYLGLVAECFGPQLPADLAVVMDVAHRRV